MATRDRREERLRAGVERLKALGISPEGASVAELERAFDTGPDAALAAAELLGGLVADESAAALRRLGATSDDKEVRREARRSLYRLAQKGVAAASTTAPPPEPPPALFAEEQPEAWLSPQDAFGDRIFWIVKSRSGGGVYHLSVVVNEPGGLKEAVLAEVPRKAVRSLRGELERRHGVRLVEVDWRYADWITAEGYERARSRGSLRPEAASWPQLRMQLFRKPAEPMPDPIEAVLPAGSADAGPGVAASAELFAEPDFQRWFLPEPVLAPYLERYAAIRDSPIVLDRQQQLGRIEEIVGDALRDLFGGDARTSWRRRLDEAAYVLWKSGRHDAARRARAVALAIDASDSGGRGIPFFEELTRRSFGLFFAREAEKEREERASSVIVTPDQLREQARSRPSSPLPPKRR